MQQTIEHIRRMTENWANEERQRHLKTQRYVQELTAQRAAQAIEPSNCRDKRNKAKNPRRPTLRGREAVEAYIVARIAPDIVYVYFRGKRIAYGRDLLDALRAEGVINRAMAAKGRAAFIDRQLPGWAYPLEELPTRKLAWFIGALQFPDNLHESVICLHELRRRLATANWPSGAIEVAIRPVGANCQHLHNLVGGLFSYDATTNRISAEILRQTAANNLDALAREWNEAAKGCFVIYGERIQ